MGNSIRSALLQAVAQNPGHALVDRVKVVNRALAAENAAERLNRQTVYWRRKLQSAPSGPAFMEMLEEVPAKIARRLNLGDLI